eukprot:GHVU01007454.1.p2 GENE.GHVU01007454.1~~GHVU01007454.1.p2  ORF type:complete len:151 (-),score=12.31 GHVU01007454.1:931-1383(-)
MNLPHDPKASLNQNQMNKTELEGISVIPREMPPCSTNAIPLLVFLTTSGQATFRPGLCGEIAFPVDFTGEFTGDCRKEADKETTNTTGSSSSGTIPDAVVICFLPPQNSGITDWRFQQFGAAKRGPLEPWWCPLADSTFRSSTVRRRRGV